MLNFCYTPFLRSEFEGKSEVMFADHSKKKNILQNVYGSEVGAIEEESTGTLFFEAVS